VALSDEGKYQQPMATTGVVGKHYWGKQSCWQGIWATPSSAPAGPAALIPQGAAATNSVQVAGSWMLVLVPSTETASSPTMRQAGGYEHQGDHLGVLMCALTAAPFASSGMGRSMAQATEQAGADRQTGPLVQTAARGYCQTTPSSQQPQRKTFPRGRRGSTGFTAYRLCNWGLGGDAPRGPASRQRHCRAGGEANGPGRHRRGLRFFFAPPTPTPEPRWAMGRWVVK
jgi:hypothetical protein